MVAVKTNNYEACLRLLSQGADANYKNSDGVSCLHAAVASSQLGQIELLCIYGADINTLDREGRTPLDLAKFTNSSSIADRLYEIQYDVTDEFIYFLCNKRPEHKHGQRFFIPDLSDK
jgi:G protein-coupled receptor kinase interacting protein 2